MANCPHCNNSTNGPPLTKRCDSCGSTWCPNGNCTGTYNVPLRRTPPRNSSVRCVYCKKGKVFAI